MDRGKATLDWQVLEDECHSPSTSPLPSYEQKPPRQRLRLGSVFGLLAVVLLTAFVVGDGLVRTAEQSNRHVQRQLEDVIVAETWARQNSQGALASDLIDPKAPGSWQKTLSGNPISNPTRETEDTDPKLPTLHNFELKGDLALVKVLVTEPSAPWQKAPYRQVRFYRQTNAGWLRTVPQESFWGAPRQQETAHFRFHYHEQDAEAVEAVAGQIEMLYAQLRQDLGLASAPEKKMSIVVKPAIHPNQDVYFLNFSGSKLSVPSPLLLSLPEEVTEAAALQQMVAAALAVRTLGEAVRESHVRYKWAPVIAGLTYWMYSQYSDLPSQRTYALDSQFREQIVGHSRLRLADLIHPHCGHDHHATLELSCQPAATATLIDYAVLLRGLESLPRLLQLFGTYDSWKHVIPAVFGVPVQEFETGWQAYLAGTYGALEPLAH